MALRPDDELAAILGYAFRDPTLLAEALTHSSLDGGRRARGTDNDRLEFLGDRVLGLIVADHLLRTFPQADAGSLARTYNGLVRRETLARIARDLELGDFLRMSRSEDDSGGRKKSAILADACEALIAALYLDGGLAAASAFVHAHWAPLAARVGMAAKDAKTALQEWAHAHDLPPPAYAEVDRSGPAHDPHFVMEARLDGHPPARGEGPSKRRAQQAAAAALYEAVEAASVAPDPHPIPPHKGEGT